MSSNPDKERSEATRAAQEEAWKTQSEQTEQDMQELQQRLWEAERLRSDAEGRLEQVERSMHGTRNDFFGYT